MPRQPELAPAPEPRTAARARDVGVVIASRDRREPLLRTLARLTELPERPPVVVVDNASTDGTAEAVRERFPAVEVLALERPAGPASRTLGARHLDAPLVALCDDDSWWAPGALARAAEHFAATPRLGLLAARILVEPGGELDPTCEAMAASPLGRDLDLPGPSVLGFVAAGAILRREALLQSAGFDDRLGFGGEEALLCLDLAQAGWGLAYVDDVVAQHAPETRGNRPRRSAREVRNALWTAWLRRSSRTAFSLTVRTARRARRDPAAARGFADALRGAPWVLRERQPVSAAVESAARLIERHGR